MTDLRMDAYYFGFDPTGVIEIDRILSAVARAGKGFHHTEEWAEELDHLGGKSYVDLIQEAANEAARERTRIASAIESLHYDAPAAKTAQATAARIARQGGAL